MFIFIADSFSWKNARNSDFATEMELVNIFTPPSSPSKTTNPPGYNTDKQSAGGNLNIVTCKGCKIWIQFLPNIFPRKRGCYKYKHSGEYRLDKTHGKVQFSHQVSHETVSKNPLDVNLFSFSLKSMARIVHQKPPIHSVVILLQLVSMLKPIVYPKICDVCQ